MSLYLYKGIRHSKVAEDFSLIWCSKDDDDKDGDKMSELVNKLITGGSEERYVSSERR